MTLELIWIKVGSFLDPFSTESMLGCQALDLVSLIRTTLPHMPCPLQSHLDQLALRAKTLEPDSVQFSCSVVSNSLWPHEPQLDRPPCPPPIPGVRPNPCPSSRWCRPTISSSVVPFSSHLQSFPASGSLQMSQFLASRVLLELQLQHQSFSQGSV